MFQPKCLTKMQQYKMPVLPGDIKNNSLSLPPKQRPREREMKKDDMTQQRRERDREREIGGRRRRGRREHKAVLQQEQVQVVSMVAGEM